MKKLIFCLVLASCFALQSPCFACTNFQIQAKDGSVVCARTMEFAWACDSQIVFVPAGKDFASQGLGGKPGLTWKSKYAFLGINAPVLAPLNLYVDGMNEAGVSVSGLLFTDGTYADVPAGKESSALANGDIASWVLGNFSNVDEIKKALANTFIWQAQYEKSMSNSALHGTYPLHYSIHDARGKSIVLEFTDNRTNVYDNPLGVLTNQPDFQWHLKHLSNYLNLSPLNPEPRKVKDMEAAPYSSGYGLIGLPGDWSSPSRFVKMALVSDFVTTYGRPDNAQSAVIAARHIIDTVDIPLGASMRKEIKRSCRRSPSGRCWPI